MKRFLALLILFAGVSITQAQDLTIALYPNLDSHVDAVIGAFEEEHGVEVEVRILEHGDHHNALVTQLATGSGAADVVAVDVDFIARFVAEGGLTDLSAEPFQANQYEDLFAEYAWLQASTTDGRLVAMPTDLGPGVMYYRRDRFEEVDADVDQVISDWDAYV